MQKGTLKKQMIGLESHGNAEIPKVCVDNMDTFLLPPKLKKAQIGFDTTRFRVNSQGSGRSSLYMPDQKTINTILAFFEQNHLQNNLIIIARFEWLKRNKLTFPDKMELPNLCLKIKDGILTHAYYSNVLTHVIKNNGTLFKFSTEMKNDRFHNKTSLDRSMKARETERKLCINNILSSKADLSRALSKHAEERSLARKITQRMILDTLQYGFKVHKQGMLFYIMLQKLVPRHFDEAYRKKLEDTVVIVGKDGIIVTVYQNAMAINKIKRKSKRLL